MVVGIVSNSSLHLVYYFWCNQPYISCTAVYTLQELSCFLVYRLILPGHLVAMKKLVVALTMRGFSITLGLELVLLSGSL